MDTQKNNLLVLGGAGLLLVILLIFGIMGAKSNPPAIGEVDYNLDSIPAITSDDNTRGIQNAAVRLIEYSDIECPFCQEYHESLLDLVERDPLANFSWTYRHFPLTQIHPDAFNYAVASECAADQDKFSTFIDTLINRVRNNDELDAAGLQTLAGELGLDTNRFGACLASDAPIEKVQANAAEAQAAGATGTPFSIFEFDRAITDDELATIQGLFGDATAIVLSDSKKRMAIGGSIGSTQIRDIVNTIVDPAKNEVVEDISEGTQ